jgi:hypothetical protein
MRFVCIRLDRSAHCHPEGNVNLVDAHPSRIPARESNEMPEAAQTGASGPPGQF